MLVELHDVPVGAEAFASPSIPTPFAPSIEPPTQTSPSPPVHPDDTRLWGGSRVLLHRHAAVGDDDQPTDSGVVPDQDPDL